MAEWKTLGTYRKTDGKGGCAMSRLDIDTENTSLDSDEATLCQILSPPPGAKEHTDAFLPQIDGMIASWIENDGLALVDRTMRNLKTPKPLELRYVATPINDVILIVDGMYVDIFRVWSAIALQMSGWHALYENTTRNIHQMNRHWLDLCRQAANPGQDVP
jgi:hypothetical protein